MCVCSYVWEICVCTISHRCLFSVFDIYLSVYTYICIYIHIHCIPKKSSWDTNIDTSESWSMQKMTTNIVQFALKQNTDSWHKTSYWRHCGYFDTQIHMYVFVSVFIYRYIIRTWLTLCICAIHTHLHQDHMIMPTRVITWHTHHEKQKTVFCICLY